jgi:hypothetical protein
MPTLMQRGAAWLGAKLKTVAGHVGTYKQGSQQTASLTATVVMQEYEVIDANNVLTTILAHDWTFTATDLTIGGDLVVPRPRDLWTVTINGNEETYEVLPIGKRPCYERMDTSGLLLKVHTKKVA